MEIEHALVAEKFFMPQRRTTFIGDLEGILCGRYRVMKEFLLLHVTFILS
jgi:hypothetical protein